MGTVVYMSPEQVRAKELDSRTDLFSFGAVLYEMATGRVPFRGESTGVIFESILNRTQVPATRLNPDLPPKLEEIINKCLEKDRNLRYQHASEIRTDLQRLKRDTESTRITGAQVLPEKMANPRKLWLAIGVCVLTIGLAALTIRFLRSSRTAQIDSIAVLPFTNVSGDARGLAFTQLWATKGLGWPPLSLETRLERLEKEARFEAWLWFQRFLESVTEQQLEDLATHWRWPEPMPPPLPIGASKLDSLDRQTLQKMFDQNEREFGPLCSNRAVQPKSPTVAPLARNRMQKWGEGMDRFNPNFLGVQRPPNRRLDN